MMSAIDLGLYLRHTNMTTWLEQEAAALGTVTQQDAYRAGRLSEAEIRQLARNALFAPFIAATELGELKRWSPMPWSAVEHKRSGCVGYVDFEKHEVTGPATMLRELATLAEAHDWCRKTGARFKIVIFQRVGTCRACKGQAAFLTAHVSVAWAGRSLSLEYAI